jgi:hypothetical protein
VLLCHHEPGLGVAGAKLHQLDPLAAAKRSLSKQRRTASISVDIAKLGQDGGTGVQSVSGRNRQADAPTHSIIPENAFLASDIRCDCWSSMPIVGRQGRVGASEKFTVKGAGSDGGTGRPASAASPESGDEGASAVRHTA